VLTDAGRRGGYGAPTIRLAEQLAYLAAQAIDNAQHHALLRSGVCAPADAGRTILLVDDDAEVRAAMRRILERCGYRVLEAWSGRHALTVARTYDAPIDLVLTDCIMPELDGRACVEQIRVRRADIGVMYMSGYSRQDISRSGLDISDAPFLPKPFTPDLLAREVRAVLESCKRN
ncbi:MAG TPA: response regulator, partial [Gemmatimonadaceae bacterium]|nr:response regulator [Gemmatimonadaceae bacterium]